MAMRPCSKCLENNWNYLKLDDSNEITATCNMCGNEISWVLKEKIPVENEGDPCRFCKIPVVKKESKFSAKKLKKAYYYTAYLYCNKCKQCFYKDRWKVINEDVCKKNVEYSVSLNNLSTT